MELTGRRSGTGAAKWATQVNVSLNFGEHLLAEGVGFEPTRPYTGPNGFQDRLLRPLGHPSGHANDWRRAHRLSVWRRGWDSNPRRGVNPLRHFECRALDRPMRPLQVFICWRSQGHRGRVVGLGVSAELKLQRREGDLNPRGSVNPQRHFQCRALGQTIRSLRIIGICRTFQEVGLAQEPPGTSPGQQTQG